MRMRNYCKQVMKLSPALWFCCLVFSCASTDEGSGLFACHNLTSSHYNFLKRPGESVTLTCPKNCSASADGHTQWYHSYVKLEADLDLLVWSGLSHEAAVKETPSHGSVGYFCCACEQDENPARDGCCWGVAYQPVVNLTLSAERGFTDSDETVATVNTTVSLRCEARGFPHITVTVLPPESIQSLLPECREVEKSWYSSVVVCQWTLGETEVGSFSCTGSILIDSADNKKVMYNKTATHQLSLCPSAPKINHFYQANELKVGSQLDLVCEIECCHVPACSATWYFGTVAIDDGNSEYRLGSEDGLVHVLTLLNPEEVLGQYHCILRSPFSTSIDNRTITLTLPDGSKPTRSDNLPGPVKEGESGAGTTTTVTVAVMWSTVVCSVVALTSLIIFIRWTRRTKPAKVSSGERDSIELIPASSMTDDVERDYVAPKRRQRKPKTSHRLSDNKDHK